MARACGSQVARSEIEELKESDVSLMPESLYKEFTPQQLRDLFSFLQTEPHRAVRNDHERIRSSAGLPGFRLAIVSRAAPCHAGDDRTTRVYENRLKPIVDPRPILGGLSRSSSSRSAKSPGSKHRS